MVVLGVGLACLLLAPIIRMEAHFTYFWIREHASRVPFDSEAWKSYRQQYGVSRTNYWAYALPVRLRMIDDLMEKHDLSGKARAEVEVLLGPKEQTPYFNDWDLVYWLGPGRYSNAIGDSEWLVLRFDAQGKVREYRVVHD